ncbi:MAG: hypothetical protein KKB50_03355 [Planctomycetes bacterium]|nr:hypothetical protein [Planctomycetota bacterium]
MNQLIFWLTSVCVLVTLTIGCAREEARSGVTYQEPGPDSVAVADSSKDEQPDDVCAAIEAARQISFSSDRSQVFQTIAARPDLTVREQTALINAICEKGFSSDKADALLVLARNPNLAPEAAALMSRKLPSVYFYGDRERVAAALADRGAD